MTKTYKLIEKLLEVAECYSDGRETYEPFEQIIREARSYLNNEKSVMTEQNLITPPPELVYEWAGNWAQLGEPTRLPEFIATRAAKWGADAELEACCEWLDRRLFGRDEICQLRAARRPKPMTELSPAAQAVLDAFYPATNEPLGIAAVLRAIAAEVVLPKYQFADWEMADLIMKEIQSIADELDGSVQ